jgi:hypothetical protein
VSVLWGWWRGVVISAERSRRRPKGGDGGFSLSLSMCVCGLTRLPSSIKTQHQQPHLFRPEDLAHHLGYLSTHACGEAAAAAV